VIAIIADVAEKGFRFGVLVSAALFGFRHGIDWDHIAAITDITSSQEERRHSLVFGTLYALGHALVVFALGMIAIVVGKELPQGVDEAMTRVVGVTLLLLGIYVFVSLIRHGRDFRLRSRWMLIFSGVRKGVRWIRGRRRLREAARLEPGATARGVSDHEEPFAPVLLRSDGGASAEDAPMWHHGHHGRRGHHHHTRPEPDETFMNYGRLTSFSVGMIHGIGAETPTQVLVFLAVAGAGGVLSGILVLLAFIVGLLASNSLITVGSALSKNFAIYASVAILTGIFSLAIGTIFVLGKTTVLPAIFGG
jgi:ABC-type nickel/cobalt efflux system permease component RcnA